MILKVKLCPGVAHQLAPACPLPAVWLSAKMTAPSIGLFFDNHNFAKWLVDAVSGKLRRNFPVKIVLEILISKIL